MSKIPNTPKTKYNKNDPFRWVDSQWEKFMTEQRQLKSRIYELEQQYANDGQYIDQLESELDRIDEMIESQPNNSQLGKIIREHYWTNNPDVDVDKGFSQEDVRAWKEYSNSSGNLIQDRLDMESKKLSDEETYIYESPDGGETVYRRLSGSEDRELVNPQQEELFKEGV